jgi:hypothetical protein
MTRVCKTFAELHKKFFFILGQKTVLLVNLPALPCNVIILCSKKVLKNLLDLIFQRVEVWSIAINPRLGNDGNNLIISNVLKT